MMDQRLYNELAQPQLTPFHSALLRMAQSYTDMGLGAIREYFPRWDVSLDAYNAVERPRSKDEYAEEDERPRSQSIPMTYAQVQTWKAFATQVLTQRPRQFESSGVGPEDEPGRELCEQVLESDLVNNMWKVKRGQILQNLGIFAFAMTRTDFEEEQIGISTVTETPGTVAFGISFGTNHKIQQETVTKRKGNNITVISPYKAIIDPCYPICDQHKARFQGDEYEISRQELKMMELRKEVAAVDLIFKDFTSQRWEIRSRLNSRFDYYRYNDNKNDIVCITRLQVKLVPKAMILMDGQPLGDSEVPCILDLWMANDCRIIKCEISNYLHGSFNYCTAAWDNEMHCLLGKSLTEVMGRLQETMDWFLNSRIESVTRNIEPQVVVDPAVIDLSDLVDGKRIIRLKKGMGRAGMEGFFKQITMQDPTVGHMDDIAQLTRLMQEATGVNANMSGQFHTGRRSATEARVVSGGAASRVMTTLGEIWESLFCPLGSQMLCNLRQGYTEQDVQNFAGIQVDPAAFASFKADPIKLATSRDFWILDATTPSEKGFQAQVLADIFAQIMANPIAAIQLDLSPRLILEKILQLQGINLKQSLSLARDPRTMEQMIMQIAETLAQQMVANAQPTTEPAPANSGGA